MTSPHPCATVWCSVLLLGSVGTLDVSCMPTKDDYLNLRAHLEDLDGDGDRNELYGGSDCDDQDPDVHGAGIETCDGVDQDCDGTIDEDAIDATTWFADSDGDGFGTPDLAWTACEQPTGFVTDDSDCDDDDAALNPGTVWFADGDEDGYGLDDYTTLGCEPPPGYSSTPGDCDDSDGEVYPGAVEVCDDQDNDCDGTTDGEDAVARTTWYRDAEGDGYGDEEVSELTCPPGDGWTEVPGDCDE